MMHNVSHESWNIPQLNRLASDLHTSEHDDEGSVEKEI